LPPRSDAFAVNLDANAGVIYAFTIATPNSDIFTNGDVYDAA